MEARYSFEDSSSLTVALEPVWNALNSFALLDNAHYQGLGIWVTQSSAALTPAQRHTHHLLFGGLRDAFTPHDEPDFPAYLGRLSEQPVDRMQMQMLEMLRVRFAQLTADAPPDHARLLEDVGAFLYCVKQVQGNGFNEDVQREVHAVLQDPSAMRQMLLAHLAMLWKTTFVAEWKRVQSLLRWQVEMFTYHLDVRMLLDETFYYLTSRHLPSDLRVPETAAVILVPSWHTGRHVTLWHEMATVGTRETVRLFFSEPPNYDLAARSAPVGRAELQARFNALADESRLEIIELLKRQSEMEAQEIIAALALSQSSVSRHLKQLVSMGYLYERRGEGANKTYRLSSFGFARTMHALNQFIESEAKTVSSVQDGALSRELRRFLDRNGRLNMWPPAKQYDKLLILEYLASFFERGRTYSEKEVNEILVAHSVVNDSAALRRAMQEYRFMDRMRDGSQYWLIGSEITE